VNAHVRALVHRAALSCLRGAGAGEGPAGAEAGAPAEAWLQRFVPGLLRLRRHGEAHELLAHVPEAERPFFERFLASQALARLFERAELALALRGGDDTGHIEA
jgi:hypothetical protein